MNQKSMVILAVGVVAASAVAGWFRPTPLSINAVNPHAGAWRIPAPGDLERSSASQFAAIRGVSWVGANAGEGSPGAEWVLLGLVGPSTDRAALIRASNDPLIRRLQPGDTLPDGSKLESVGSNEVVVVREGCRLRRPLYPAAPDSPPTQAPEDACEPAGID